MNTAARNGKHGRSTVLGKEMLNVLNAQMLKMLNVLKQPCSGNKTIQQCGLHAHKCLILYIRDRGSIIMGGSDGTSLISLMVSVDVKHHVYLLTYLYGC